MMQVGLACGTLLAWILVDFGAKLGGKLEPSWPILAILSCLILPYLTLPYLALSYLGYLGYLGHRVEPRDEGWGQQVSLGNTRQDGPQSPQDDPQTP